jgi:hypothetical protein
MWNYADMMYDRHQAMVKSHMAKDISDGVENKTREGKKITNICPQISDNVTTTGGGGNSYGMILTLPL